MCGIIGAFGDNPHRKVLKQYKKQKSRGSEGFGFVAIKGGKIVAHERSQTFTKAQAQLEKAQSKNPDAILFHHRYPTSTANVREASHPIPLAHKKWRNNYYLLHNGIITDTKEEEKKIRDKGYSFVTKVVEHTRYYTKERSYDAGRVVTVNDSEILGYYLAEYLEGNRKDIPVSGSIACLIVKEDKGTGAIEVYALRNFGNPLSIARRGRTGAILASEAGGAEVEANALWRVADLRTGALELVGKIGVGTSHQYEYKPTTTPSRGMGYDYSNFESESERGAGRVHTSEQALLEARREKLRKEAEEAYEKLKEAEALRRECKGKQERRDWAEYIETLQIAYDDLQEEYESACEDALPLRGLA